MAIGVISPNVIVCGFDDLVFGAQDDGTIKGKAGQCINRTNPNDTIVGYIVWEATHPSYWMPWVEKFLSMVKDRKFIMVLNTHYKKYDYQFPFDVVYLDFFILRTWFETSVTQKSCGFNRTWSSDKDKFLFLFGKLEKPHRIRLLYKLHEQGLLDACIWSLRAPKSQSVYRTARELLPELSNGEFDKFIKTHEREADEITTVEGSNFNYGGFPYDKSLFADTLFRLSPECYIERERIKDTVPWITEKTWITILNNQPFIIPGEVGTLKYLRDMGFKTFNDYLPISDYDNIIDVDEKLDACVTNVAYCLNNHDIEKEKIKMDINHNFNRFKELVKINEDVMYKLGERLQLPNIDVYRIIPLCDDVKNEKWAIFYNDIRDVTWPPCLYETDFTALPQEIQDECIDTFGYVPLNDK